MSTKDNKKGMTYFAGLIIILAIYSCFNVFFQGDLAGGYRNSVSIPVSRQARHLIRFASIGLVYVTGMLALRSLSQTWSINLWSMIYLVFATLLIGIGVFDLATGMVSQNFKEVSVTISELLMSPVLYIVIGILNWKMKEKE